MSLSSLGKIVHDLSSIGWSTVSGIAVTSIYVVLMAIIHRRWAATGAIGRVFIEVWFLSGIAQVAAKVLAGHPFGQDQEDYVFIVLGLLLGAVICLKHVLQMFAPSSKIKLPTGS